MLSVLSIVKHLHNSEFGIWYNMHLSVKRYNLTFSNTNINAKLLKRFYNSEVQNSAEILLEISKKIIWLDVSFLRLLRFRNR